MIAAGIACGAWAFCLGARRFTLLSSSTLGAIEWFVFISATQLGIGKVEATTLASLTIGAGDHLLAGSTAPIIRLRRSTFSKKNATTSSANVIWKVKHWRLLLHR